MKTKIIKLVLILSIILTVYYVFPHETVTFANSNESAEQQVNDAVNDNLDRLDTEDLQDFIDGLTEEEKSLVGNDEIKLLVKSVISGDDKVGFNSLLSAVLKNIADSALGFLPAIISVVIISVLYGLLSSFNAGFLDKSVNRVVYFACYGAALVILINEIISMINLTVVTADRLKNLMTAVFPVMLTLMSALGGATGAGLIKPLMSVAAGFIINFITEFVIPCFVASVILAVAGNLSDTVKLNRMSLFFKKAAEVSLGVVFGAFLMVLTAKGIVGKTADGVAVNAAKFALSGYVPILGRYVADGFDVVMAGCILIKNALGVTGLLIMLAVLLMPVVKLTVFTFALKFAAAATEPLGDGKMSDLLMSVSKSTGLLISSLVGLAFMFFAVVMLVTACCNLGVV